MDRYPVITQLDENGNYDFSFSGDGTYTMEGYTFCPSDLKTYSTDDGYNILVGGYGEGPIPQLMLINQDGVLVNSFGIEGIMMGPSVSGTVCSVAIDESNGYAYCCILDFSSDGNIYVMKIDIYTGELDNSFGINGIRILYPFGDAIGFSPYTVVV